MKRAPLLSFLLLSFLIFCMPAHAQDVTAKKREAKQFYLNGQYDRALSVINNSRELRREDKEGIFLRALCYYHLNDLNTAEELLQSVLKDDITPYPEVLMYLGKIYHQRQEFSKASDYYKAFLKVTDRNHSNRQLVISAIRRCANGQQYEFRQPLAFVENLGNKVNTPYDEIGPVVSPGNPRKLYFSSARQGSIGGMRDQYGQPDYLLGHYRFDMFSCMLIDGQWTEVQDMHHFLNGPGHEVLLDFSANGRQLFYYRGNMLDQGRIYVDTFSVNRTLTSDPVPAPIDAMAGDVHPHFVSDREVIFASRRPGGYGGLDLYRTRFQNGRWSTPENLGPAINSPFDETTPFLANDGITLYFSSNNDQYSIGEFDIFKSVFNEAYDGWSSPYNLGIPINSPADDTHFRLVRDGYTAYFASDRKDGFGMRDIYSAYFFDYLPEMEPPQTPRQEVAAISRPPVAANPSPVVTGRTFYQRGAEAKTETIAFQTEEEIKTTPQREKLLAILSHLKENPETNLWIAVRSRKELAVTYQLYAGMQSAGQIADYFIQSGIDPDRIIQRSHPGTPDIPALRSAELFVLTPGAALSSAQSNTELLDDANGLVYRIRVARTSEIYRNSFLAKSEHPRIERRGSDKKMDYLIGHYASYAAAAEALETLTFARDAQIMAYINGQYITPSQVDSWLSEFPDLENYRR